MDDGVNTFKVELDAARRIITIQGINYSFDMFNALGFAEIGTVVKIEARADGVVTVTRWPADRPDDHG